MVNTFRYGFLGISDLSIGLSYAIIIGFIVALYSYAVYLLRVGYGIRR
jgi:ABC-2 type transport system permease protein